MTAREVLLVLHIAAVAGWLGANYTQLFVTPRFDKIGGEANRHWTETTKVLGERYYGAIGAFIILTGIGLVAKTPYDFSSGFVGVGIGTVIFGALFGVLGFAPQMKKRIAALDSGDGAVAKAALRKIYLFAVIDTLVVLMAVVAMVHKWKA